VKTALNLQFAQNAGNFLSSWMTVNWQRTLFSGVKLSDSKADKIDYIPEAWVQISFVS
jgi:hypothetical protein